MRDITEDEIQATFGEKAFSRGKNYFENDSVVTRVKKGDILVGKVWGSAPYPYQVTIEIGKLYAECTCPEKTMCNHGVALLLQWTHKKKSFVDVDRLLGSLWEREKEELIRIIQSLLEKEPTLASDSVFSEKVEKKINKEALSKRIHYICRDFVDYYDLNFHDTNFAADLIYVCNTFRDIMQFITFSERTMKTQLQMRRDK
jgi:uncharacterized Zn finger protein